jgi:hypothetical protein
MNGIGNASNTGLIQIPIILLLFVGILAFAAWKRHPGWWLMVAGDVMMLLGFVSQLFLLRLDTIALTSFMGTLMAWLVKLQGYGCGLILFAFGFATIGAAVVKVHRRNLELEPTGETAKPGKGGRKP